MLPGTLGDVEDHRLSIAELQLVPVKEFDVVTESGDVTFVRDDVSQTEARKWSGCLHLLSRPV